MIDYRDTKESGRDPGRLEQDNCIYEVSKYMRDLTEYLGCTVVIVPNEKQDRTNEELIYDFIKGLTALYLAGFHRGVNSEHSETDSIFQA